MKFKLKAPNTLVLVFGVLCFFAALTWIIPAGQYERVEVDGREIVNPEVFNYTEAPPAGLTELILAPFRGFTDPYGMAIITFIFIVAGAFSIVQKSGAFDVVIRRLARLFVKHPAYRPLFIPFFMFCFSVMGATFGMSEETIVFIPLFVTMAIALGYDSITGVAIPFVGAALGFAGAMFNPFTVGIAQGLAEIQLFSGVEFRTIMWLIITIVGIGVVYKYAAKIHKNPTLSPVYNIDKKRIATDEDEAIPPIKFHHIAVLFLFFASLVILVIGVIRYDWYILELSGLFTALAILAAIFGRLSSDEAAFAFMDGMKDVMGAAIIIALSRAILLVITDAQIVDTILFTLVSSLDGLNNYFSAGLMLVVQTLINVIVPSGSGQAALTIPIMAPLGDLLGISRQTVVLIFQLGDGITNMIIPTSGVLMGVLGMAKIPWEIWAKWVLKLLLILYTVALIFITLAVAINF